MFFDGAEALFVPSRLYIDQRSLATECGRRFTGNLSAIEIVEQMQRYNRAQIEGLKHYEALRHYHVEYRA